MKRLSARASLSMLAAALVIAGACSPAASPSPTATGTGTQPTPAGTAAEPTPTAPSAGSIQISGAGATFPYPLYSQWFYQYAFIDPSVKFNYQSIGSGGGIQQITAKTVDFGASDAILNADQFAAAPGIQMFPSVAGAVVPVWNISELVDADGVAAQLTLDAATLSGIYLGTITKWNDPAIAGLNPDVTLPDLDVIVVHRSDGSGTSFIYTDYLSNVSDVWQSTVGNASSVEWPVGLGGKGNEGVAGTVLQNDGAIGYVELAYAVANKMNMFNMVNSAGNSVTAAIETTQSALDDFGGDMPDTLARSIVNGPGANTWPIAGYTYLLLYMDQTDCTIASKLVEFINWAHTADGDSYASALQYVPLPDSVKTQMLDKLGQITCNGSPLSQ
jgi:phosphate transport system substrate-binding protein